MKTYYDLLSVEATASSEEVKRAFRREIARYHPDKVQHLGPEFQEIAASRAAALTEAYRILMDAALRRNYDESIADGTVVAPVVGPEPSMAPSAAPPRSTEARPAPPVDTEPRLAPPPDRRFQQERAFTTEFLRKAVLAKVRDVMQAVGGEPVTVAGMDAAYAIKGRKGLFKKAEPAVRLLVKVVPEVTGTTIEESWGAAVRAAHKDETVSLLLMGSGLASARELSASVSELRRKTRQNGPVVVPVDMRDWEALFPPETPMIVRSLLDRLRQGD